MERGGLPVEGRLNYYEHHLGDFKKDAAHLTMLQEGAYRRLLDAYYIREAPLPAQPAELIPQLAGAHSKPERAAVDFVVAQFFRYDATIKAYRHKRCDEEIARFRAKSASARGSANARWAHSVRNANASLSGAASDANASDPHMRNGYESHALQSPVSNPQSPDKYTHTPKTAVTSARASVAAQRTRNGSVCVDENNSDWEEREDAARG